MRRNRFGKKKLKTLEQVAKDLEMGTGQAFASLWYFENDSEIKGHNWGYAAKAWAKKALSELEKLFPESSGK